MSYKVFIGIDQSKETIDAAVISIDEQDTIKHCQFINGKPGFQKMVKWVKSLFKVQLNEVLICSENTGLYSVPLCFFLDSIKVDFWLENPLQIKLSIGLKRGKTDKADAMEIANYCIVNWRKARLFHLPSKSLLTLKELLSFREKLIKIKMSLSIPAKELKAFNADYSGIINKESNSLIKSIEAKMEAVDKKLLEIVNQDKELKGIFDLIISVHGVGKQTALFILIYTNGFTRFNESRKFACYCGIAPFKHTSGTSIRGRTRVSYLANKKLKALLTMCAINTIKKENELKIYYDRRIKEGKSHMSTLNILRNKIVSRIFATVKRGTPYQKVLIAA